MEGLYELVYMSGRVLNKIKKKKKKKKKIVHIEILVPEGLLRPNVEF